MPNTLFISFTNVNVLHHVWRVLSELPIQRLAELVYLGLLLFNNLNKRICLTDHGLMYCVGKLKMHIGPQ